MPREIRTESDLSPEKKKQFLYRKEKESELKKDPDSLTFLDRIKRIEIILGIRK